MNMASTETDVIFWRMGIVKLDRYYPFVWLFQFEIQGTKQNVMYGTI